MNIIKEEMVSEIIHLNDIRIKTINYNNYNKKKCCKIKDEITNHIFTTKKSYESFNNENKKKRNPGVDLIRVIASYLIVLTHSIFYGNIFAKYPQYSKQIVSLHFLTDWHNNSFALISGIIGYKKCRYSNLIYLWLTVHFYSVGIHIYSSKFKKQFLIDIKISKECFPIVYKRYWYFTAYFAMYFFLPVINKGISGLTKSELKFVVMSILALFVFWRDFKNTNNDIFIINSGYSMVWLLTLYITGAYIGKYRVEYHGFKKYIFCLICIFIYSILSYSFIKINLYDKDIGNNYLQKKFYLFLKKIFTRRFDSFLKTTQAIIICLLFLQIYYNQYIDKIICFFGPLAFGVYLIHFHPIIVNNVMTHIFDNEIKDRSLNSVIILLLLKSLKIFIFCILIEYIRNKIFSAFNIRKLCVLLENEINKKIS